MSPPAMETYGSLGIFQREEACAENELSVWLVTRAT